MGKMGNITLPYIGPENEIFTPWDPGNTHPLCMDGRISLSQVSLIELCNI